MAKSFTDKVLAATRRLRQLNRALRASGRRPTGTQPTPEEISDQVGDQLARDFQRGGGLDG